jgi:hypothetical protein
MNIITWLQTNWLQIAQAIAAIIGAASIIVKLTPTLKDDTFLLKVIKFLGKYIALNVNAPTDEQRAAIK